MQPASIDDPARAVMYESRLAWLAQQSSWTLDGRLAVSNAEDGGSGHFSWTEHDGDTRMDFYGALGRGAWRLAADAGGAELELADGTVHHAGSIEDLVRKRVGWEVPVDKLSWWARGLAAPGEYDSRILHEDGSLSKLQQSGWTIEYGKYRSIENIGLPVKMVARSADWKVKLAVTEWKLAAGTETDD